MSLDSTSTREEVLFAYADSASYDEVGSIAKARQFVTACRILLVKIPTQAWLGKNMVAMDVKLIKQEMQQAQRFVAANASGNRSENVPTFEFFRD